MKNIFEKVNPMVQNVLVKDKEVLVVVDNIKAFKNQVVDAVHERKNKRRNNEARFNNLVSLFARAAKDLKGKHVDVRVVVATDKPDLFRNAQGRFVKF